MVSANQTKRVKRRDTKSANNNEDRRRLQFGSQLIFILIGIGLNWNWWHFLFSFFDGQTYFLVNLYFLTFRFWNSTC